MSHTNGNGSRLVALDGQPMGTALGQNAKDADGRHFRHNATVADVYNILAKVAPDVHEFYAKQIPMVIVQVIDQALMAHGLVTAEQLEAYRKKMQDAAASPAPKGDSGASPTGEDGAP